MKAKLKGTLLALLIPTFFSAQIEAAVPDLLFVSEELVSPGQLQLTGAAKQGSINALRALPADGTLIGMGSRIAEALSSFDPMQVLKEDSEEDAFPLEFIDSRSITPDSGKKFWTGRKIMVVSSLLLATGLAVGLLAMFGQSSGGSGSGSNSGGGSGAGNLPPSGPGGPDPNFENAGDSGGDNSPFAGGGGNVGGDSGGSGGGSSLPGSIPNNPEPSTLLLFGLGLLIPYFRKK